MNGEGDDVALLRALPQPPANHRDLSLMHNTTIGVREVMTGSAGSSEARAQPTTKEATSPKLGVSLSPDLNVVRKSRGPVMTVLDELYKVGPGPSSSHTIGPMRITYDFYQRCTK